MHGSTCSACFSRRSQAKETHYVLIKFAVDFAGQFDSEYCHEGRNSVMVKADELALFQKALSASQEGPEGGSQGGEDISECLRYADFLQTVVRGSEKMREYPLHSNLLRNLTGIATRVINWT